MRNELGNDATESVRTLMIFPLAPEWKQVLLMHECTFGEHEDGEMVIFPEGTTRTLLLSRTGQPTNRSRILFPDGLELREVLDDEGTGKCWLQLVLSQEPMQDTHIARDHFQGRMRGEGATEERREARKIASIIAASRIRQVVGDGMQAQQGMEEQDVWEGPGEHNMEEAQALIEKALARVGLITVLTRRLESHGDLLARNSEMIPTGEHSPGGLFDITGEGEKIIEKGGKRWGRYISKELHYQQCFQQHFNLIRESQPLATRLTSCAHASDIPISISSENRGPLRLLPP